MYHNGQICDSPVMTASSQSSAHAPDAAASGHAHAPHRKGKRTALIWGISGTVLSAVGWIALMLFEQYNASLAELRGDLKHFNDVRAEFVKKESLRKMIDHLKDSYKELQAAAAARELIDRELKASEKSRRVLARELQKVRERLAGVEGRQAATTILLPGGENRPTEVAAPRAHAPVSPTTNARPPASKANERMEELLFESEDFGPMEDEWLSWWLSDQPSHMTYQRVHGGIGP